MVLRGQNTTTLVITGVLNTDQDPQAHKQGIHNSDKQFGVDNNGGDIRT
jgi:hypothetical protein